MPYKTGISLLGVARNPANGFPARLLGQASFGALDLVPNVFNGPSYFLVCPTQDLGERKLHVLGDASEFLGPFLPDLLDKG